MDVELNGLSAEDVIVKIKAKDLCQLMNLPVLMMILKSSDPPMPRLKTH